MNVFKKMVVEWYIPKYHPVNQLLNNINKSEHE